MPHSLKPRLAWTFEPLPPFHAVVMDMDGLALDTEATYCTAWQRAAAELGYALSNEFCRGLFGRHADDVKSALAAACGSGFDPRAFHAAAERHWLATLQADGVAKMPGLDRLLAALRRHAIPYALATNSDEPYASLCLDAARARHEFPVMVTRDQVASGKPAPDLFLEAARRLGVPPARCLALEDSPPGLTACIEAGMVAVWIPPRHAHHAAPGLRDVRVMQSLDVLAGQIEQESGR